MKVKQPDSRILKFNLLKTEKQAALLKEYLPSFTEDCTAFVFLPGMAIVGKYKKWKEGSFLVWSFAATFEGGVKNLKKTSGKKHIWNYMSDEKISEL